jgi:ABC-type uncharacterized transport system permease subunit
MWFVEDYFKRGEVSAHKVVFVGVTWHIFSVIVFEPVLCKK